MDWLLLLIVVTTSAPAALKNHCRRAKTEKNGGFLDTQETSGKVATCITKKIADISMTKVVKSEEMEPGTEKE